MIKCKTCGDWFKSKKELKRHEKYCHKTWSDGYKVGMNTGLDFVKKYCEDYQYELAKAEAKEDKKES